MARSSVSATVRKTYNILSWQQLSLMFHRHRYCARGLRQATIFEVEVAQDDEWIGAVTLKWIGLLKIPTVALVSKSAHKAVELLWRYVRHSPRDQLSLRNKRCQLCGWITNRKYLNRAQCCKCSNTKVCFECTYVTADGRRLCGVCDLESDAPLHLQSMVKFLDGSGVHDALDYLQNAGHHSIEKMKQKRMPNLMQYLMILWHRFAHEASIATQPTHQPLAHEYLNKMD